MPVVPNFYATTRVHDTPWAFGLGVYTHFGLKVVWPYNGPFRYVTTESDLVIPNFNPTVSYKINDKLSVAGGLVYAKSSVELKSALPIDLMNEELGGVLTGAPDGEQIMTGDGDGIGANAGILYRPNETHSFGLSWRSDMKIKIDGEIFAKGFVNETQAYFGGTTYTTGIKSAMTLPPSVLLGYAFRKGKFTWALDGEWMGSSAYRSTEVKLESGSLLSPFATPETRHEYGDAWSLGTGVNYTWNETWQTRAGYTYYPSIVPEINWEPGVPDNTSNGLHCGATWSKKSFSVDASYSLLNFNTAHINNNVGGGSVNGDYDVKVQVVSLNFTYRI